MAKHKTVQQVKKEGVTPLGDRVLLKPLSADEYATKRASGIIIPETVDKERPEQGKVIAVGPGRYDDGVLVPMRVKVGDTVVFSKYGYDEIKIDGVEYFILKEESILAVIK
ncbi:co-chaperone GroES [Candidatus Campbellbacteria bacterium]|nr:MAG: co-chaperone GroES [Candidatus Campbellbacteria bacterium]